MEVPVNILIKNKTIFGLLNIPDHQYEKPIVVIMCYGFNGDRVEQHRMSVTMGRLSEQKGINFCRFDFRNQGLSEGTFDDFLFSEKQEDINKIIDFIKACFRRDDLSIYLIGFSNGCKVAIDALCDNTSIDGIILWNPILQELADNKNGDAGDSRRLYKHPVTGKPYKRFYSLRLNTSLLHELNNDKSMSKFKEAEKDVLCILSRDDPSIERFRDEMEKIKDRDTLYIKYVDNTDHLFGSVEKVKYVIDETLNWVVDRSQTKMEKL